MAPLAPPVPTPMYIAIVVAHNPSRALELLGYQRLIHSASKHFNTSAWLNYDVQFRTLAAANPQLQWNLRHSELWLDNMASHTGSSLPNTRWPCTYCGSMYHFPDRCPRCPFRTVQFNDGDRDVYHHQLLLSIITSSNYHDTIFITIFILTFVLILTNKTASYHLIFIFTLQSLYFIMCVSLKIIPEPLLLPPGNCFKCPTGLPLLVKMLYVHKLN